MTRLHFVKIFSYFTLVCLKITQITLLIHTYLLFDTVIWNVCWKISKAYRCNLWDIRMINYKTIGRGRWRSLLSHGGCLLPPKSRRCISNLNKSDHTEQVIIQYGNSVPGDEHKTQKVYLNKSNFYTLPFLFQREVFFLLICIWS